MQTIGTDHTRKQTQRNCFFCSGSIRFGPKDRSTAALRRIHLERSKRCLAIGVDGVPRSSCYQNDRPVEENITNSRFGRRCGEDAEVLHA